MIDKTCKHHLCHKGIDEKDFDCMLCYCPLYLIECAGNFKIIKRGKNKGKKDCSDCVFPHTTGGKRYVLRRLKQIIEIPG